jgi:predicted TIM-barrel fold metal-dependent hydrolase
MTDIATESSADVTVPTIPKIISVDDHVVEPPHLWEQWLPPSLRDFAPRIVRKPMGELEFRGGQYVQKPGTEGAPCDWWSYEDLLIPHKRHIAAVGFPRDQMSLSPITYEEMRPGCYDPAARVSDMELNWVEKSLCFPTFPRFCGQTFLEAKDRDVALACVYAYNNWMVEEWCGDSGGALIPLCLVPLWSPSLAATEVRRNAARGVRAVAFSENPSALGLPSVHDANRAWDPFFEACAETGTVVCMHIGSSSKMPTTSPDAPAAVSATLSFNNAMASLTDFLFSGVLVRFPKLKLAYSEGQIGWIPYIVERADDVWLDHRAWGGVADLIPEPPSTYYRRQVYGCFFKDRFGIASLRDIGVDRVTFETDYPHTDSTWPDTKAVAEEMFTGLDDDVIYKIVRGNAIEMLGLEVDAR